jgi:hypothetical protein
LIERSSWKKQLASLLIPYLSILLGTLAFYAASHALDDLIGANVIWPLSAYSDIARCPYAFSLNRLIRIPVDALSSGLPPYLAWFLGCFLSVPLLLVAAVPGLLIVTAAMLRGKLFPPGLIPFWICGVALMASEAQRPDIWHLAFGCPILLLTLSALWQRLKTPRRAGVVFVSALALFMCMNALITLSANKKVETRRGTIYSHSEHPELAFLRAHTLAGDYVFVYPYRPILNFLSDTRNPTRFSYFVYGWQTPGQFREATEALDAKRVRYILFESGRETDFMTVFPHYRAPSADERIMELYLASRYREVAVAGRYRILERIQ